MRAIICYLLLALLRTSGAGDPGLRSLLLDDQNQALIDRLGTRYEVVHPYQVRKTWGGGKGLDTRVNGGQTHEPETTLLLETFEYKLQMDLELNTKLFAPTLVQLLFTKDESPIAEHKLPENCYYHATVRNYPEARAAFRTCDGIRGVIHLGQKIFYIHPLHGNHSGKHPHLLYHYTPEDNILCGSTGTLDEDDPAEDDIQHVEKDDSHRARYIEMAVVMDRSLFQKFQSLPSEVFSASVEIINLVDLLYRPLNTSVSLVYLELWTEDQVQVSATDISSTLQRFREYAARRISRISVDAMHLITGVEFEAGDSGKAFLDSICTNNAVGISRVINVYQPHVTAFTLAHMIGHNLGMSHDHSACECPDGADCIMGNDTPLFGSTSFSRCSAISYQRALAKGHGACLYNMPTMRVSICGNSILEEPEQCDCGTVEDCLKTNPCCDPITCRLIKHAQCSSGPCCRKCKLLSPDHLCRPSRGECDIPEFCDGRDGQCPKDVFKRNGAVCSGGLGYCFQGECPVLKHQCQDIWGQGADSADPVCFERLNVQGTPNGNCGTDGRGGIAKCDQQNSYCGFLQCSSGEKTPVTQVDAPVHFVVHRINTQGTVHECKAKTLPPSKLSEGLVRDGTKCGYQKVCLNQTCTSLKSLVSGKCPAEDSPNVPCSGHGICTNANTCFCDEGWKGPDCAMVDEEWRGSDEYYEHPSGSVPETNPHLYGQEEMNLSPNLAITVIAASVVIGIALVLLVALFLFYRHS